MLPKTHRTILFVVLFIAEASFGDKPRIKSSGLDMARFREQNLLCHNKYREKHGVKALSYSDQLHKVAQKYAEELAERDVGLVHSQNGLGENLQASQGLGVDGFLACNSWYDEIKFYKYGLDQPENLKQIGHFTQLVWKGTCFMGVGVATSKSGWTYVVANYDPPGNEDFKFRSNVPRAGTRSYLGKSGTPFESLMREDEPTCSDADSDTFRKQNLHCHNVVRRRHGVKPLSYDSKMNEFAQKQAEALAKSGGSLVSENSSYGENVFSASGGKKNGFTACKHWYGASNQFNYSSDSSLPPDNALSFTQMVWKSSSRTGVGVARSEQGQLYVVSVYDPPGNFLNQFKANVLPPVDDGSPADMSTTTAATTLRTTQGTLKTTSKPHPPEHPANSKLFRQQNLDCHNEFRKLHGVQSMTYKPKMNDFAQEIAEELARKEDKNVLRRIPYGYNVYFSSGVPVNGSRPCTFWYKGKQKYPFDHPPTSVKREFRSFAQMVWKQTNHTGIGISKSASGRTYVVALYDPAGNVEGEYGQNVKPPS